MRRLLITLVAMTSLLAGLAFPAGAGVPVTSPTTISVHSFNIAKAAYREWGWAQWLRDTAVHTPDILLLQDIEGNAMRQDFETTIETFTGQEYTSARGTTNTPSTDYHWAIMWREARFTLLDSSLSRSFQVYGGSSCALGSGGADAIQVKLQDDLSPVTARRSVSAVSFKTSPGTAFDCAWKNARHVSGKFADGWAGALQVMGTDANNPDRNGPGDWTCWYRGTVGDVAGNGCGTTDDADLGWRDPLLTECGLPASGDYACLENTHAHSRIDFLFVKKGTTRPPTRLAGTAPLGGSALYPAFGTRPLCDSAAMSECFDPWSDHRSVHTLVDY